jgi:hypothetical protein
VDQTLQAHIGNSENVVGSVATAKSGNGKVFSRWGCGEVPNELRLEVVACFIGIFKLEADCDRRM